MKRTTRKRATDSDAALQQQARAIIKLHGITFGFSGERRCIYADHVPQRDIDIIAQAMRRNLV